MLFFNHLGLFLTYFERGIDFYYKDENNADIKVGVDYPFLLIQRN